jgi:MFS family permease
MMEMRKDEPTARASMHRWKVLGVGFAANASFSAAFSGIPSTAVWMRQHYGWSTAELGAVLGMLGLGVALSELPWGVMTDRWGDRKVLLLGLMGTVLALALTALPIAAGWHAPALLLGTGGGLLLCGLLGGSVNGASGLWVVVWEPCYYPGWLCILGLIACFLRWRQSPC